MPVVNTKAKTIGNLVKKEFWADAGWCRLVVTANDAAQDYLVGTALGKVTIGGKYKVSDETETDGSEDVVAVVLEKTTIPATTDTNVLVAIRGPLVIGSDALILDSTYDNQTKIDAAYASLATVDISVETQV